MQSTEKSDNIIGYVVDDDYQGRFIYNLLLFKDRANAVRFAMDILGKIAEDQESYGNDIFSERSEEQIKEVLMTGFLVSVPVKGFGHIEYAHVMILAVQPANED
jgi:hypothetical protein